MAMKQNYLPLFLLYLHLTQSRLLLHRSKCHNILPYNRCNFVLHHPVFVDFYHETSVGFCRPFAMKCIEVCVDLFMKCVNLC